MDCDGSPAADAALDLAADLARASCRRLRVVVVEPGPITALVASSPGAGVVARVATRLAAIDGVEAEVLLTHGEPIHEILQACATSALVVLGSRGSAPLRRIVLGSVAQAVVRHAAVPAIVVPAR